ncbi:DinB family protein [Marinibaculum pumilum]|uniref:DinB family protein n=1 Tax=Marinibaculum pumilum TaxID=1766165 RepID=A0ABV7KX98_9PROT
MLDHFRTFARYIRWANAILYDAAADLSATDYFADRGAFFGSLHGTLNHVLAGDRIWLKRITGEGEAPPRLDGILAEDLAGLRAAREAEDARIVAVVDGMDPAALDGMLHYRTVAGRPQAEPLAQVLAHLFNHQTHHRGQASAILTGLGRPAPEMDLIFFLRQAG